MHQAIKKLTAIAVLVGSTAFVTQHVVSQDDKEKPSYEQEMAAWAKLAQPGVQHKNLMRFAGKWESENIHYQPGQEPNRSRMYSEFKPLMGGRFMMETVSGRMNMGGQEMDFEGMGIFGFDNLKQQHFYVWFDNFGTMMMTAWGDANETGDEITYWSSMPNPMGGGDMKIKSVSRIISDDETVFEMYMPGPEGKLLKNMQINSHRK